MALAEEVEEVEEVVDGRCRQERTRPVRYIEAVSGAVRQSKQVSSGMNEVSFLKYCSRAWCGVVVVGGMQTGAWTNKKNRAD
jgi:hypothetical protein